MVRIIIFFFIFIYSFHSLSDELTSKEIFFFNLIDLDKNKNVTKEELNKLIKLIFQLVDKNQDGNISQNEIIDLKDIIRSLS